MADKFVTLLEEIGSDIEKGISKVLPTLNAEAPVVTNMDPALGHLFALTIGVLTKTAQAAKSVSTLPAGSTEQQLSDVLSIIGPTVSAGFASVGKQADSAAVSKYVLAVQNLLNAIPASPAKA